MKKLFALFALTLMSTAFALTVPKPATVAAANGKPECTVKAISGFVVESRTAMIQYEATGANNCESTIALKAYLAPAANGEPHDQQELQSKNEKNIGKGKGHIKINMLENSCFYQIDLVRYNGTPKNEMLAFKLGGRENCIPPTVNTCDALTATALSRVSYGFQAKASASGRATLTSFSYDFGDGKVGNTPNGAIQHDYAAPGTYTVKVNANFNIKAQFDGTGKDIAVSGPACTTQVTVTPPTTAYECTALTAVAGANKYSFKYNVAYKADGVTLKTVDFNFGDGTAQNGVTVDQLGNISHTYTKDGTYTTNATLHFANTDGSIVDSKCAAQVTIATPPTTPPVTPPTTTTPPTELVHTGPASVAGMFAAVAIIGAVAHNLVSRRRQA